MTGTINNSEKNSKASVRQAADIAALRWKNDGRVIPDTEPSAVSACLERYREEAAKNVHVRDESDILDEFARTCFGEFLERFGIRFQDAPEPARYAIVGAVCDDLERDAATPGAMIARHDIRRSLNGTRTTVWKKLAEVMPAAERNDA